MHTLLFYTISAIQTSKKINIKENCQLIYWQCSLNKNIIEKLIGKVKFILQLLGSFYLLHLLLVHLTNQLIHHEYYTH